MGFVTAEQEWMTKQKPEVFKQYVHEAMELCNGILTGRASQRIFDIIDNKAPFSHLPWRVISLGVWLKKFGITLN